MDNLNPFVYIAAVIIFCIVFSAIFLCCTAHAEITEASYYTVASCLMESGKYVMANGQLLDDKKFTCASWKYPFGTVLKVTNLSNGKSILTTVKDRGPSRKLVKKGRSLDLSLKCFSLLTNDHFELGVIKVRVEKVDNESKEEK